MQNVVALFTLALLCVSASAAWAKPQCESDADCELDRVCEVAGKKPSSSGKCVPDKVAPIVELLPLPGYVSSRTLRVEGTVFDNRSVQRVWFTLDGDRFDVPYIPRQSTVAATFSLAGPDGSYKVMLHAKDAAGNTGSQSAKVILDTLAPEITVAAPVDGAVLGATEVSVSFTVTEQNPAEIVVGTTTLRHPGKRAPVTYVVPVTLPEGEQLLTITAKDDAGNSSRREIKLIVDVTPPDLVLKLPEYVNTPNVWAVGEVSDKWGVLDAWFELDGVRVESKYQPGERVVVANLTLAKEGPHTVVLWAVDIAQNRRSLKWLLTFDAARPTITLDAPADGSVFGTTPVPAIVSVADNSPATVTLWTQSWQYTSWPYPVEYLRSLPLPEGQHTLIATSTDAAGNVASDSATIWVDLTPPVVTTEVDDGLVLWHCDPANIATYRWNIYITDVTATIITVSAGSHLGRSTTRVQEVITSLQPGLNVVTIIVTDGAGHETELVQTFYLEVLEVDDGDACTDDTCDPLTGDAINEDTTPAGQCCAPSDGALTTIDDGDACTDDTCDLLTGDVNNEDTTPTGQCCAPSDGALTAIVDGNACTVDTCDPLTGDVSNDDTTPEGQCCAPSTGALTALGDGDACTVDTCDALTGDVSNVPMTPPGQCCAPSDGALTAIADGDACTIDTCDPETGAVHSELIVCASGNPCVDQICAPLVDYGIVVPTAESRGHVVVPRAGDDPDTTGGHSLLVWLYDAQGTRSILSVDLADGDTQQILVPQPSELDAVYASLLASNNRLYTLFGGVFYEFEPAGGGGTFRSWPLNEGIARRSARDLSEGPDGRIWAATYPDMGLVSFDPATSNFVDHGVQYCEQWTESGCAMPTSDYYPLSVEVDVLGFVYIGLGKQTSQIVAFDPDTQQSTPLLPPEDRVPGTAGLCRFSDGAVYARNVASASWDCSFTADEDVRWYRLYAGDLEPFHPPTAPLTPVAEVKAPWMDFRFGEMSDGREVVDVDLTLRIVHFNQGDPIHFDSYDTTGANLMQVGRARDGSIFGGSFIPHHLYRLPGHAFGTPGYFTARNAEGDFQFISAHCQANTLAVSDYGEFIGCYPTGDVVTWNLDIADPAIDSLDSVPNGDIYRPKALLAHPDRDLLVFGGVPTAEREEGYLRIVDLEEPSFRLTTAAPVASQFPNALAWARFNGVDWVVGGTSAKNPAGDLVHGRNASLFLTTLDGVTHWSDAVSGLAGEVNDLIALTETRILGIYDRRTLFVFDASSHTFVSAHNVAATFGRSVYDGNGSRVFVEADNGQLYLIFEKALLTITNRNALEVGGEEPIIEQVFRFPQGVKPTDGGAYSEGRVFFGDGPRLFSVYVGQ